MKLLHSVVQPASCNRQQKHLICISQYVKRHLRTVTISRVWELQKCQRAKTFLGDRSSSENDCSVTGRVNSLWETTNQKPLRRVWQRQHAPSSFTHCLFQWAWTMLTLLALCRRVGDCSSELGLNYKKRPVQIRRDGFIIRLKCQLLQKPIPRRNNARTSALWTPNYCCQTAAITTL